MAKPLRGTLLALAFVAGASVAWAKLPPPPPMDEKAKAAADEKKAKAAEQAKADLAAATDKMIKNRDANLRKAGKPIPKATPVVAAAPAAPAKPGEKAAPAPAKAPEKPAAKKS